jgi:hypothetical protein
MTLHVPLLTEVYLRAWGTDDPRVLPPLRAENQPARTYRTRALERRAIAAGWPTLDLDARRMAATDAVRRLEGDCFDWNGSTHHRLFKVAAYTSRHRGEVVVPLADDDGSVSIFDE